MPAESERVSEPGHEASDDGAADSDADRTAELARNLAAVRARIEAACAAAGREDSQVSLIAVTKFFPASDVVRLLRLGLREFGENRDQEAAAKSARVAEILSASQGMDSPDALTRPPVPRWHFIGQLQSNKVRSVVCYADVVQSVDRIKLVAALDQAADRTGRTLTCLVQVNLDAEVGGEPPAPGGDPVGRGGAAPADVERIADAVAGSGALRLGGLMAVAPLGADPRPAFERLAALAAKVRGGHPEAVSLSAGMSGDLEAAVAAGATHVRIGSALLGRRPALR